MEADERYPDSCFVEDPAVVMERCAVITNPATDSRNGEKHDDKPVKILERRHLIHNRRNQHVVIFKIDDKVLQMQPLACR